jgi:hypothetical protein
VAVDEEAAPWEQRHEGVRWRGQLVPRGVDAPPLRRSEAYVRVVGMAYHTHEEAAPHCGNAAAVCALDSDELRKSLTTAFNAPVQHE